MTIHDDLLRSGEKALFELRALYRTYGYTQYKMSKFEEYDLYVRNQERLVHDGIIAFTDTNGRLMALKPDVTLSIIKNSKDQPGVIQKVCYNENVYRVSKNTHAFKEIMQTGLECMGDIDLYSIAEVLQLAAESLNRIRPAFQLDISHMGLLTGLIAPLGLDENDQAALLRCVSAKNMHELRARCAECDVPADRTAALVKLAAAYGPMADVLRTVEPLCIEPAMRSAWAQLSELAEALRETPFADRIQFDFSVVNPTDYYDGIVFQGFVDGIPDRVLSGGQYDRLMHRMGRKSGAIGFAVYMDLLERLGDEKPPYDVDTLLLYDAQEPVPELMRTVQMLTSNGRTVLAEKAMPAGVHARQTLRLQNRRLEILENNG